MCMSRDVTEAHPWSLSKLCSFRDAGQIKVLETLAVPYLDTAVNKILQRCVRTYITKPKPCGEQALETQSLLFRPRLEDQIANWFQGQKEREL